MLRRKRLYARLPNPAAASRGAAVLALAMAAGGCSAGLDMPPLSYTGGPTATHSVPVPRAPVYQNRDYAPPPAREARPYGEPYGQPYDSAPAPSGDYGERPYTPPYERQSSRPEWRQSDRGTPLSDVGERGVRVAALPEPYDGRARAEPSPVPYRDVTPTPSAPHASFDAPAPALAAQADGQTIEVRPGDTLFGLARQHGVSVDEIKRANHLQGSMLRVGQRLVVPHRRVASLGTSAGQEPGLREPAPLSPAPAASFGRPEPRLPHHEADPVVPPLEETAPAASAPAPAPVYGNSADHEDGAWTGTYTVQKGDSLFAIARKHGVNLNELERANDITNPRRVMPGTVLKVPRAAEDTRTAAAETAPASARGTDRPAAGGTSSVRPVTAGAPAVEPTIINARTRVAALGTDAAPPLVGTDAGPARMAPAASAPPPGAVRDAALDASSMVPATKFRWPARGKIIAKFGPQGSTHNDGINIALPRGADVHAAEAGVVTYAGDGVAGYGNLVLIRHDGGWITAYAHNDELTVKPGATVRRGQVIAKAGATGNVDTPQLHFEIRQGTKPVDPTLHLER